MYNGSVLICDTLGAVYPSKLVYPSFSCNWGDLAKVACVSCLFQAVFKAPIEQSLILGTVIVAGYKYLMGDRSPVEMIQSAYSSRVGDPPLREKMPSEALLSETPAVLSGSEISAAQNTDRLQEVVTGFYRDVHENMCCKKEDQADLNVKSAEAISLLGSFKSGDLNWDIKVQDCIDAIDVFFSQVQGNDAETTAFLSANCPCCLSVKTPSEVEVLPRIDASSSSAQDLNLVGQSPRPTSFVSGTVFSKSSLKKKVFELFNPTKKTKGFFDGLTNSRYFPKKLCSNIVLCQYRKYGFNKYYQIDGDGNCYYRAVMFATLQRAIEKDRSLLQKMKNALEAIAHTIPEELKLEYLNLLIYLEKIYADESFTVDKLLHDINAYPSLDGTLVRAARYLLYYELSPERIHAVIADINQYHPLQGQGILETTITELRGRESDYRSSMLQDKAWAEGEYIDLQILPRALGWEKGIAIMMSDETFVSTSREEVEHSRLLFTGNHYDVVSK